MQKNLAATIPKVEEDPLEALSNSSNNSGQNSPAEHNALNSEELDTLCDGSKKIRKKRNAYQKIDDNIRLRLLEAVKHGETLKSAAKKFKINYSSAKSILHTYRKEGRILKKSAQERNIKRNSSGNGEAGDGDGDVDGTPHEMSDNEDVEVNKETQTSTKRQASQTETAKVPKERVKSEGLATGQELVDNLVNILKMNGNTSRAAENAKPQMQTPKAVNKTSRRLGTMEEELKDQGVLGNSLLSELMGGNAQNPANLMSLTQMLQGSSIEKFKVLDNLFGNMSGSPFPIVSKAIKAYTDSSGSKTEAAEKDTDSPSEEANTMGHSQGKQSEEIVMPHPLRFNTAQLLQEKIETQLNNNSEEKDWDQTIENAAIDTFKSFMDAQLLLCDALKKASYLNSLMQAQKAKTEANPVNPVQSQL